MSKKIPPMIICSCGTPTCAGPQCLRCEAASQAPVTTERQEGIRLVSWLDAQGLLYVHVPNGMKSTPTGARSMKLQGLKPGAPDYLIWHPGPSGAGAAVELKTTTGRQSKAQVAFERRIIAHGWSYILARSAIIAIEALINMGFSVGQEKKGLEK